MGVNMRRIPLGERLSAAASLIVRGAVPAGRFGPLVSASDWNGRFTEAQEIHVDETTALNTTSVYACVTLLADTLAQLPFTVGQKVGDTRVTLPDHPVARLLSSQVNDYCNRRDFIRTVEGQRQRGGNGLAHVERDASGSPVGLWPLQSASIKRDENGAVVYETSEGGERIAIPAANVVHVKGFSTDGGMSGLSPVAVMRRAIQSSVQMDNYAHDFFRNESKSGGFILHPGRLSEAAKDNIVSSIKRQSDGKSPAGVVETSRRSHHNIKVLEEGAKWVATTIAPEEAQFLGSREFQLSEIARGYRVPLVLLQSQQGSTVWGTGIESLMIGFAQFTISPLADSWSEALSAKLLTDEERAAGLYIRMDIRGLLRGDQAGRAAYYASGIQHGWLLPNEARAREDLNPIDGGDEPLRSRAPSTP